MEEMYFFIGHHALSHGYSVLIFDGPGRGSTLFESGMKLSHLYDEVLVSILDTAAQHGNWKHGRGRPISGWPTLSTSSG
jgi:hypothetical protein